MLIIEILNIHNDHHNKGNYIIYQLIPRHRTALKKNSTPGIGVLFYQVPYTFIRGLLRL